MLKHFVKIIYFITLTLALTTLTSCEDKLKYNGIGYYYGYNQIIKKYATSEWKNINNNLLYFNEKGYVATQSELPYGFFYNDEFKIERKDFEIITFGRYEQDNNIKNGLEDLKWIVIDEDATSYKLLSLYGIDNILWHNCADFKIDVTWEECSLRKFLNSDFINLAFNQEEKNKLLLTKNYNINDTRYGENVDKETEDFCYLLNYVEANKYFPTNKYRICKATDYAKSKNVYVDKYDHCNYVLRSIADQKSRVSCINLYGEFVSANNTDGSDALRPIINIKK